MRTFLRKFLLWLDTRFPEKVVVTNAQFLQLLEDVKKLKETSSETRIHKIEQEINKFNVHMGFGGSIIPKGMAQQFQR